MEAMRAIDCSCGDLHIVRWSPSAGIDGAFVYVCPDKGKIEIPLERGRVPGRWVTDFEESRS